MCEETSGGYADLVGTLSRNVLLVILFTLLSRGLFLAAQETRREVRAVTVADTIQMKKLADPVGDGRGRVVEFSPDRDKFVAVLRNGDIEKNLNRYSLWLWVTDRVSSSSGRVLVTMSSSSNRPGIERVSWLDNDTVAFLGEGPRQTHELYSVNSRTMKVTQLTRHRTNVIYYGTTKASKIIAYVADAPERPLFDENAMHKGLVVDNPRQLSAGVDNLIWDKVGGILSYPELYVQAESGRSRRIRTDGAIQMFGGGANIALSPAGTYLVMTLRTEKVPIEWREYSNSWIQMAAKETVAVGDYSSLMTYVLIDTRNGKTKVLLNVPVSWGFKMAWSPDGRAVAIGETLLPLGDTTGEERERRRLHTAAVEVEVPSGKITVISKDDLRLSAWDRSTGCLLFQKGSSIDLWEGKLTAKNETVCFKKRNGAWGRSPLGPDDQPEITLDQDSNSPPRIYATQRGSRNRLLLLDPNPLFQELQFGKVEEITWKDERQREMKAGLYYPVDFTPGKRYPLVIQTHGWSNKQFWIDGPFTTAFAAQPLAGRGIMVVQLSFIDEDKVGTLDEAPLESSQFEKIIQYLDDKGLIDPRRVGIIGFSRTCFHVKFALTHSEFHFAAASVTEGFDGGYVSYALSAPSFTQDIESVNGGPPFGNKLQSWLERAPDLNLQRLNTPLLITSLTPADGVYDWEWFGMLRILGKPVDMIVLKDGSHELERPRDRLISQQGTVDWFCFWLKGEEDPDSSKAEQYARWRKLRSVEPR